MQSDNSPDDIDYLETWKGMEEARALGLTNSIGVSNFNETQIDRLFANSRVKPVINEIEVSNQSWKYQSISDHNLLILLLLHGYEWDLILISIAVQYN